jgi:hypothetical protein
MYAYSPPDLTFFAFSYLTLSQEKAVPSRGPILISYSISAPSVDWYMEEKDTLKGFPLFEIP